ncbi:MAG TPA: DNA-3-methyladenine glycosylase, partial [Terriglobales bacterium]|nr:DNA-3-methyladenine glycosylase [Terriglobales bacterium]
GDGDRTFPSAESIAGAELDGLGMPRQRAESLRQLARAVARRDIDLDSSDAAELTAKLCALSGIGPWTAQYITMRALGEPDVFLPADLGVRRALANGAGLPSPRQAEQRAEAWRPWRSYAVLCLWHSH